MKEASKVVALITTATEEEAHGIAQSSKWLCWGTKVIFI